MSRGWVFCKICFCFCFCFFVKLVQAVEQLGGIMFLNEEIKYIYIYMYARAQGEENETQMRGVSMGYDVT